MAALLRHHLYGSELPDVETPRQEFVRLAYYLELVTEVRDIYGILLKKKLKILKLVFDENCGWMKGVTILKWYM